MHASVSLTGDEGCIIGADVDEPVVISGMAICVVLPSREVIEEKCERLAQGARWCKAYYPIRRRIRIKAPGRLISMGTHGI